MDDVFARIEAVRQHRREIVERVAAGALSLPDLFRLAADDPVLAGTKVLPLVEALPEVGKVRSRRALEAAGIDEAAHIDQIAHDARAALVADLAAEAA